MIFLERDRAEILNLVADLSIRLIEAEEKIHALEKDASYWYERYKETRSNNDVQGVPFVAAPARDARRGRKQNLIIYAAGAGNRHLRMNIMILRRYGVPGLYRKTPPSFVRRDNMVNYFSELNSVDVSGKTESKNGLTYLSWAWAWGELKKRHPDALYTIYEDGNGRFYHTDGKTCWVKTGVTVNGLEHIEYLPVMTTATNPYLLTT